MSTVILPGRRDPKRIAPEVCLRRMRSDEVRGDFDTYQVYRAEGDNLIHLRSEFTDPAVLALYCTECGERIGIENLSDITIE